MLAYVLNKQGHPLMPCVPAKARRLLKAGQAKVVSKTPFVIKMCHGSSGYKQPITAGMDTGSKVLGCAAVANGRVLYQSEVTLRSDVSAKMEQRKTYRRNRRSRKTRYRPARFDNRGKAGKVAPSIHSKVQSHLRERRFVESILPVTHWMVELASFDIHKITNPEVSGAGYQQGAQKDYYNLKAYILHRDHYQCQQCKAKQAKLQVHHIVFRSQGGTDTPDNLITLCLSCHDKLHADALGPSITKKLRKKTVSKTKPATEMGIVKAQLKKSTWRFKETFGYETKYKREQVLKMPKTHYHDAVAVCTAEGEIVQPAHAVLFKKHVSKGDYRQTSGSRSEKRIPTGKLFGLRKFDLIQTPKELGFIKGKRSSGCFSISELDGTKIHDSVNVKKDCFRIQARATTLTIQKGEAGNGQAQPAALSLPDLKDGVSRAI